MNREDEQIIVNCCRLIYINLFIYDLLLIIALAVVLGL